MGKIQEMINRSILYWSEQKTESIIYSLFDPSSVHQLGDNLWLLKKMSGLFLINKTEALKIIKGLENFYLQVTDEDIKDHNHEIDVLIQKEMFFSKKKESCAQKRKKESGYVYFLQAKNDNKQIKIGKSKNINNRILQISPQLPYQIEFLFAYQTNDMTTLEQLLHQYFSPFYLNREWFDLADSHLDRLKRLKVSNEIKALVKDIKLSLVEQGKE